jgi:hypothetical protein
MEEMTDKQYNDNKRTLILLILEIIENSESLKEAKEKIEALLPEE